MQTLHEFLEYCPFSGQLTWKIGRGRARAGDSAGCKANGYIQVRFLGKLYYAHRLAYYLMTGTEPAGEIDHINGDTTDNRWNNLRVVTGTVNQRNASRPRNNTSGVNGVSWDSRKKKWKAAITVDRKSIFLGYFNNIDDAAAARKKADEQYGFHPNHGRAA
jgi:hypothetical protein